MKKFITSSILMGTAIMSCTASNKVSDIKNSIIFDMDYSYTLGKITAQKACGNAKGTLLHNKKATFAFEPMSTINNGLLVGHDCASVRYHVPKNLSPKQGSIELVVRNDNWQWDDAKIHTFMQSGMTPKDSIELYIYKYEHSGVAAYIGLPDKDEKIFLRFKPKNWKAKSWHHLVLTYDTDEVVLYADGIRRGSGKLGQLANWGRYFNVGPAGKKFGRKGKSTIRSVTCYNRALNLQEIKALAKSRLPDLKIDVAEEDAISKKQQLQSSPWFKTRPKIGMQALEAKTVPAPWEPVEYNSGTVSIWNRTYNINGKGLIASVTSAGQELLSAPICLNLLNGAKRDQLQFGTPEIIKQAKGRISIERKAQSTSGCKASLRYIFEYDGMVWCELHLDGTKEIKNLQLQVPLKNTTAQLLHYVGVLKNSLRSVVGPQFSYSQSLSQKKGILFSRQFCSHIWVGNNDYGLQWFSESDQYWWPKDRKDMIQIVRDNTGQVSLNLNMITSQLPALNNKPLVYKFGFIATPVKPMPVGWRGITVTAQYDSFKGDKRGTALIYWPDEWEQLSLDPEPNRALNVQYIRDKVKKDRTVNRKIIPYWSRLHFPITESKKDVINPDALKMKDEWSPRPQRPRGGVRDWMRASTATSWSDYLVWCVDQWAQKFGHIDGVYMDEMELTPNFRGKSGGGYTDVSGKRRPTYSIMADRNMYKRMNHIVSQRNKGTIPWSVAHCSGTHMMEVLSPFTMFLVGEHLYSGYFTDNPELLPPENDRLYYYSYALPMDRLRAEFYWKQWGAVLIWLPCLKNQRDIMTNPIPTRDLLSRIMQADMLVWPLWCNAREVQKTLKFRKEFGIADPKVSFTPYWNNKQITPNIKNVAVGYYKNSDKLLVIVSNLNRTAKDIILTFKDLPLKSVKNAETNKEILLHKQQIKLEIPRNDYRALRINY